jgi:hypothetical protein
MQRRSKSNGISSTLRYSSASCAPTAVSTCASTAWSSRFFRPVWWWLLRKAQRSTSDEGVPKALQWRASAIRSCVSVPVLSVHSTSIAPRFWIASRRLTTTLLRDSTTAPLARVDVTIIGSISGVSPTATESANSRACVQSPLVSPLSRNTMGTITRAKRISSQLTPFSPAWNSVGAVATAAMLAATPPK